MDYSKSFRNYPDVNAMMDLGYFIYDVDTSVRMDTLFVCWLTQSAQCINCTMTGDNKVPDFWVEE